MKTRILFVDDEPNVLSGLRRLLRSQRNVWEMEFANGGQQALDTLEANRFDVVVSDMRMPSIDGAELLQRVAALYPDTVRLILSGQSEHEKILRAIGPAHQFLSKPCDPGVLIHAIERTCALNARMQNPELRKIIAQIDTLPSLPVVFEELVHELQSSDPSIERVGEIVSSDVAMTAKVLQLVNSSFFGLPQHVSDARQAASMLGLNIIQPLALTAKVFSQFEDEAVSGLDLESLITHSLAVAMTAKEIALAETESKDVIDHTFLAGTLHDIGKIILASRMPEAYHEVLACATSNELPLWQSEQEILGATHAEVGAVLLGLWGLPTTIVEAVAYHHCPCESHDREFSALTAVHVSNAMQGRGGDVGGTVDESAWDMDYLSRLDLARRAEGWRAFAIKGALA